MHYVVGSGPNGVAAASALLDRGVPVTMLDVGVECEPERLAVVRRMGAQRPEQWASADVAFVRGTSKTDDSPFPLKLAYGSAFPYATGECDAIAQSGTRCVMSYAKGGLSNVWGAAVLPNNARDFAGWPVTLEEMASHYASVARLMPIAAEADELEPLFPFYAPPTAPLRASRLADALLMRMRRDRHALEAAGIFFGRSRLAVRSEPDGQGEPCRYTGLCLSGCPYLAVWTAAQALDALQRRTGFTYRAGLRVDRVEPFAAGVRLSGESPEGVPFSLDGRRVLLACGPLSTSRIVLESAGMRGRSIHMQAQPYFLLPVVAFHSSGRVEDEHLHTLAQLFVELIDPALSAHPIHLQVYTYNEFIRDRLARASAALGPLGAVARRALAGRLLAIQGYLHSSEGTGIRLTADPDSVGRARLTLSAGTDDRARDVIARVVATLARHAGRLGVVPLKRFLEVGRPGDGNHVGGTFPMSATPDNLQTDRLGQLKALPGVHLVDSSVLPSLAATTFTYTTMANAHRIADAVADMA